MAEVFYFHVQEDRSIKYKLIEPIMQEDKDVATWRFRIPKVLNEIDMSAWSWWFVYVNAKGQEYSELLTLTDDIDEPSSYSTADYDIDYGISKFPGSFSFALEAISAQQGGEIDGEWHTRTYSHKVDKTLQGNQAEYAETESDVISALMQEVRNKVNQLVGGATPLPVNLKSLMTDHDKVYLYTGSETGESTGYWYYYNGTQFVPGGQYGAGVQIDPTLSQSGQAADAKVVGDEISDLKEDLTNNFHVNGNVKPNLIVGSFVNATNNSIGQSDNFSMTEPIAVKKGQQVTLTARGYNQVIGMITTCNADNTERVTVVVSVDSSEHDYIYNVTEDGYIICSFDNRYNHKIALSIDYYSMNGAVDLLGYQKAGTADLPLIKNINRMIVGSNGTVQTSDNFFISQSINLYKGQTINLTASGYNTAVAMISLYDAESDTYIPLVISVDSTERTYTYTATSTCVVRCSMRWYNVTYSATIYTPSDMLGALIALDDKSLNDVLSNIEYPQLFDNVLCVGDSLTVGYDGSGDTPLVKNYPHFLRKLTDAETTNKAHGGWTAKQIWDGEISTATDLATYDCAIIFLGTNGGLTDTVSTECFADYTQNADTNTGCYGKIIGKIKATAPNCKIFVVAGVNDYIRRATTMNPAVRALADFYSVGLIDVENCIMSDGGGSRTAERYLYRPIDGIHYNALGYMTLANLFYDAMNLYMGKNRSMYT